jgi:hypothetical protein
MIRQWGQIGVKAHALVRSYGPAVPMNSSFSGRCDRNRTGTLRLWSTRRAVQDRPGLSNLPLNWRFLATHRPAASKNVQPVCSQFCSQRDLQTDLLSSPIHCVQCIPWSRDFSGGSAFDRFVPLRSLPFDGGFAGTKIMYSGLPDPPATPILQPAYDPSVAVCSRYC